MSGTEEYLETLTQLINNEHFMESIERRGQNKYFDGLIDSIRAIFTQFSSLQKRVLSLDDVHTSHWAPLQITTAEICANFPDSLQILHHHLAYMIIIYVRKHIYPRPSSSSTVYSILDTFMFQARLYRMFRYWLRHGLQDLQIMFIKKRFIDILTIADRAFKGIVFQSHLVEIQNVLLTYIFTNHQRQRPTDHHLFLFLQTLRMLNGDCHCIKPIQEFLLTSYDHYYRELASKWSEMLDLSAYMDRTSPAQLVLIKTRVTTVLGSENAYKVSNAFQTIFYGQALVETLERCRGQYMKLLRREELQKLKEMNTMLFRSSECIETIHSCYSQYLTEIAPFQLVSHPIFPEKKLTVSPTHKSCYLGCSNQDPTAEIRETEQLLIEFGKALQTLDIFVVYMESTSEDKGRYLSCAKIMMSHFNTPCQKCTLLQRLADYLEYHILNSNTAYPQSLVFIQGLLGCYKDRRAFAKLYRSKLLARILQCKTVSRDNELQALQAFLIGDTGEISDIRRMIEDDYESKQRIECFQQKNRGVSRQLGKQFYVTVLSRPNFSKFKSCRIKTTEPVQAFQKEYERYFAATVEGKGLVWVPQHGTVTLRTSFFGLGGKGVLVRVTLDQFAVLNLLEEDRHYPVGAIVEKLVDPGSSDRYSAKNYVKSIIASLMSSEFPAIRKVPIGEHMKDCHHVILNSNFKTEQDFIALPKPTYANYEDNIFNGPDRDTAEQRVLETAILRTMKCERRLPEQAIYAAVSDKLAKFFLVTDENFCNAIEKLVGLNEIVACNTDEEGMVYEYVI